MRKKKLIAIKAVILQNMKNLVISHCYFAVDSYEMSKDLRLPYTLEHLKKCLASKQCSVSRLNCRYLNPYIKFKLIELAISLYLEFWNIMNCQIFVSEIPTKKTNQNTQIYIKTT